MPTYVMQHDCLPRGTIDQIEKEQRKFIWGEQGTERKWHAIAWENLCKSKDIGGVGVKDLGSMNEALVMKLLWRMYNNKEDLWVQVLMGKYGRGKYRGEKIVSKKGDSKLWRQMCGAWDVFQLSTRMKVHNGKEARVWLDNWISGTGPLLNFVPDGMVIDKSMRVYQLIDDQMNWNLEQLRGIVPLSILEEISGMVVPIDETEEDQLIWEHTGDGVFSTASAYNLLLPYDDSNSGERVWKLIWKLQVPERVKVFLWQALHGRLPTRSVICKWSGDNPLCKICTECMENQIHALRDCNQARRVWTELVPESRRRKFLHGESKEWILLNLLYQNRTEEDSSWPETFPIACWHIWKFRNLKVHDPEFMLPRDLAAQIRVPEGL